MNGRTLDVMIVDDEPVARRRLAGLINDAGHRLVAEAGDAADATAALEQAIPDVMLLDVEMPGESGVEFARRLARQHPQLVVILVTAHDAFSLEAFEAGVRDYVLKPVRPERLARALERAAQMTDSARPAEPPAVRLTVGRREERVPLSRIDYFAAEDGYVLARSSEIEGFVDSRLHELEERFGDFVLCVRRGCLAVKSSIKGLESHGPADHRLLFHDGLEPVAVSRRQLPKVRAFVRGDDAA